MGQGPNSSHRNAIWSCLDLSNQALHIEKIVKKQTSQQIARNRLRLKATIDVAKGPQSKLGKVILASQFFSKMTFIVNLVVLS